MDGRRRTELVRDFKGGTMNVAETREMGIDLRDKRTATQPLSILEEDTDVVEDYNWTCTLIANWTKRPPARM